jgi:hypothetical protein
MRSWESQSDPESSSRPICSDKFTSTQFDGAFCDRETHIKSARFCAAGVVDTVERTKDVFEFCFGIPVPRSLISSTTPCASVALEEA